MTKINSSNDDRDINHKTNKSKAGNTGGMFLFISILLALGVAGIGSVNYWSFEDHLKYAIYWIIFSFFIKLVVEAIRLGKLEEKVNARYASGGSVQGFADDEQILQEYRANITDKNIPIEIFKLYFTFVICKTKSKSSWTIDRGELDSVAYAAARGPYEIQLQQWKNTAAIIESNHKINQNEIRHYNLTKPQGTMEKSYPMLQLPPKPSAPNEFDYVTYTEDAGVCESYLEHKRFISANVCELYSKNFGAVKINILDYESKLESVYGKVYDKIVSGELKENDDISVENLMPLTSNQILSRLNGDIESGLLSNVRSLMGYYDKNPKVYNIETTIETRTFKFPVLYVIIGKANKTWEFELVDSLDPKIVIVERD
jgi:hypothetical protein